MFRNKSRLLLFGALAVLFISLLSGGFSFHGMGMYHFHGWGKIALIAFAVYFLVGRCGCCGTCRRNADDDSAGDAESAENESDEDESARSKED